MITLAEFHARLEQPDARGYALDAQQRAAVDHEIGPLWLLAGPGSGKTEVLVTRTLRLLCVDAVEPRSIVLTTFTEKAARNLEDRMAGYLTALQASFPVLRVVDLADARIGTLHGLCNDILQEHRFAPYQNVRLLDEVEQSLFLYRNADIANCSDVAFWSQFPWLFTRWRASGGYPPSKWDRVRAAEVLFNRIVEDYVDLASLRGAGGHWSMLANFYEQYTHALAGDHKSDFAHLQLRFLEFLMSATGDRFIDGTPDIPRISYVLVDEYQDTNPIQERIYFAIARNAPHNLTVVGDDDQSLYRFRGGTVSCMVNFDSACHMLYGILPHVVDLVSNYRSHPHIIDYFNNYVTSFPVMTAPGARAPGKKPVVAGGAIGGAYPAVIWINGRTVADVSTNVATFVVSHLIGDGIISDFSQCAILFRSTKESARNAGPFADSLRDAGVPIYNPRSKTFMEEEEVQFLLGLLVSLIDPGASYRASMIRGLPASVDDWLALTAALAADAALDTSEIEHYMIESERLLRDLCARRPDEFLDLGLLEIAFRMLSRAPFPTWRRDPVKNTRLAKVTRLLESYHSIGWDQLRSDASGTGLAPWFTNRFYNEFIAYLLASGVSDEEDDEVIVPLGMLPLMTIHQAKGLEFPVVIVVPGPVGGVGASQMLEHELAPYRGDLYPRASAAAADLAQQDDVRLLYVAYSRAEWALAVAGTRGQLERGVIVPGADFTAFRRSTIVYP